MISKIKTRMASEEGFTLIELLVVIIILGILVAIAVPAYLSFAGKAKIAAAESNVRSAIPAAESYYESNNTTYTGISGATLRQQAPGISPNVKAGASNSGVVGAVGDVYCIQDSEDGTLANTYSYLGGAQPAGTANAATIVQGACPAAYAAG